MVNRLGNSLHIWSRVSGRLMMNESNIHSPFTSVFSLHQLPGEISELFSSESEPQQWSWKILKQDRPPKQVLQNDIYLHSSDKSL